VIELSEVDERSWCLYESIINHTHHLTLTHLTLFYTLTHLIAAAAFVPGWSRRSSS
jgi:hypothetical protein